MDFEKLQQVVPDPIADWRTAVIVTTTTDKMFIVWADEDGLHATEMLEAS